MHSTTLAAALAALALAAAVPAAAQVTFVVDDKKDLPDAAIDGACATVEGTCTLRAAVQEANATVAADTIQLPDAKHALKIVGAGEDAAATGDLDILEDLTIEGVGVRDTKIKGKKDRVFHIAPDVIMTMTELAIEGGKVGAKGEIGDEVNGGGILNHGDLTLIDVVVTKNAASDDGGGIANLGGMLTATRLEVSKNKAGDDAGGIDSDSGSLVMTDWTVAKNTAGDEGGGLEIDGGTAILQAGTVNGNKAKTGGAGGISLEDGGNLEATNVTVSGNKAKTIGGGLHVDNGTALLTSITFKGNKAAEGGAIFNDAGSTVTLQSSLLDKNKKTTCGGAITSGGGNVEDTTSCGLGVGEISGVKKLQVKGLKKNGGPTLTHALKDDSPAIDAGDDPDCPNVDQRGLGRQDVPGIGTAICDAGAYEFQPPDQP